MYTTEMPIMFRSILNRAACSLAIVPARLLVAVALQAVQHGVETLLAVSCQSASQQAAHNITMMTILEPQSIWFHGDSSICTHIVIQRPFQALGRRWCTPV